MPATETVGAVSRSVTQLGRRFGLSPQEFNVGLRLAGLYDGVPGAWLLTEKGMRFATEFHHENGYGGYAHRSWDTIKWMETVIAEVDLSEDGIARIRQFIADRRASQQAALKAATAAEFLARQAAKQVTDATPAVAGGTRTRVIVGLGVAVTAAGLYTLSLVRRRRKDLAGAPQAARDRDDREAPPENLG